MKWIISSDTTFEISGLLIESDDWIIGNDDGQIEQYSRSFRSLDTSISIFLSDSHELNARIQWNGLNAQGNKLYLVTNNELQLSNSIDDFSESEFSMQVKYRYQLAPLSDLILVYSRQGTFYTQEPDESGFTNQFKRAYSNLRENLVTLKFRYML